MKIFRRYKLVIKIINSTVLNKLQSYSRISALGPECHCTTRFKRVMCISCRPHVDVHKGEGGSDSCGQAQESNKSNFFVDIINGWSQWKVVLQVNGYFNIICLVDELSSYREDLFTP